VLGLICPADTVMQIDTIITERIIADTVVVTSPQDTVILTKDKLVVQVIRQTDTLTITGQCLPDTVIVEKVVYMPKEIVVEKVKTKNSYLFGGVSLAFVLIAAMVFAYLLIKRR
jgi:hypothetical protein